MGHGKCIFFKSSSAFDKTEPHLKQMMFRSLELPDENVSLNYSILYELHRGSSFHKPLVVFRL